MNVHAFRKLEKSISVCSRKNPEIVLITANDGTMTTTTKDATDFIIQAAAATTITSELFKNASNDVINTLPRLKWSRMNSGLSSASNPTIPVFVQIMKYAGSTTSTTASARNSISAAAMAMKTVSTREMSVKRNVSILRTFVNCELDVT